MNEQARKAVGHKHNGKRSTITNVLSSAMAAKHEYSLVLAPFTTATSPSLPVLTTCAQRKKNNIHFATCDLWTRPTNARVMCLRTEEELGGSIPQGDDTGGHFLRGYAVGPCKAEVCDFQYALVGH